MNATLLLGLLCRLVDANAEPAVDRCDVLECNAYYDCEGRLVFRQLIAWDNNQGEMQVFAWRMDSNREKWPTFDHQADEWVATWQEDQMIRQWCAPSMVETWTQDGVTGDPEMVDRERVPVDRRRPEWKVK